jgi:hypothetical protein
MGKWKHRMSAVDEAARRGLCAECGPVEVVLKAGRWCCGPARRAQRDSPNRQKFGRGDNSRSPHGLTGVEAAAYRDGKSCAVCGSDERLGIDHCHETGVVRGVLCHWCNTALGLAKDDPATLRALANYLEK